VIDRYVDAVVDRHRCWHRCRHIYIGIHVRSEGSIPVYRLYDLTIIVVNVVVVVVGSEMGHAT
jgi:hypothetical protein